MKIIKKMVIQYKVKNNILSEKRGNINYMQVRKTQIEETIIDVARRSFFLKGYKKTRLEEIAKEGYTATANIYTYFKGKEDIFNKVIGDTPFKVDEYIEKYYTKAIRTFKENWDSVKISNIFPEVLIFDSTTYMNLYILLEGAEGTKYAHYKKGLYSMLQDCTRTELGDEVDPLIIGVLTNSFVSKILRTEGIEKDERKEIIKLQDEEIYTFNVHKKRKEIELVIFCWGHIPPERLEGFWNVYEQIISNYKVEEYEYTVDCRGMPVVFDAGVLTMAVKRYYNTHFKAVNYVFNKEQITLAIEFERLAHKVGHKDVKIVLKE